MSYASARGNFRQDVLREVLDEPATRGGKDMAYILKTPAGTFTIEPDEADWKMFKLCIGGPLACLVSDGRGSGLRPDEARDGLAGLGPNAHRRMSDMPCRMGGMLKDDFAAVKAKAALIA